MSKGYRYVGSYDLLPSDALPQRFCITSGRDVLNWIATTKQILGDEDSVIATFIVDLNGCLWIADRHSEHVQCARGKEVLSAGEMKFTISPNGVEIIEVTNQSTGYCPEPESWLVVQNAIDRSELSHPHRFTNTFVFRRCVGCDTTNIVKEDWFVCAVCNCELSTRWNYD